MNNLKKVFTKILLVALICVLFTGCGSSMDIAGLTNGALQPEFPGTVITTDEAAIQQVIVSAVKAESMGDLKTLRNCFTPEFLKDQGIFDEDPIAKQLEHEVSEGNLVQEDTQKFLQMQLEFAKKMNEKVWYKDWQITVSGDTAVAVVTADGPTVDHIKLWEGKGLTEYRDGLYRQACGMDEKTAKSSLSPKEFSAAYIKVQQLDNEAKLSYIKQTESTAEFHMKKTDNIWRIAETKPVNNNG